MSDTDYSEYGTEGLRQLSQFAHKFDRPTPDDRAEYNEGVALLLELLDSTPDPDSAKFTFGYAIGFAFKSGYLAGQDSAIDEIATGN